MKSKSIAICVLLIITIFKIQAQDKISLRIDSVSYKACIASLPREISLNLSDIARYFIDKPYFPETLEGGKDEKLVVNLRQFDCTTLIESSLSIYETMFKGSKSFFNYKDQLRMIRYRGGWINGYTSRLHYMTDWAYENSKRGIISNITTDLGGTVVDKQINYMSTHPDLYKHLKNDSLNIKRMIAIENNINERHDYIVLPKSNIKAVENMIKEGDIILFATKTEGLDYSHAAIAVRENNILTFIHASSRLKQVIIEKRSLAKYCNDSRNCTGITVLRIKD